MTGLTAASFNWLDYIIIGIIVFSILVSLMRGFLSEAVSLLIWILAIIIALKFSAAISNLLAGIIHQPKIRVIISFILILVIVLVIGSIINHFLGLFVKTTGLSGPNRLLGMVFGLARGVLLVAILLLFAKTTSVVKNPIWHESQLIPHFQEIADWLAQLIPQQVNHISHYFGKSQTTGNS
jgi:membrane protein required for colicin V production